MAAYICSKCRFFFERTSAVDTCPDCGNMNIRYATNEEVEEYRREHAGDGSEKDPKKKKEW